MAKEQGEVLQDLFGKDVGNIIVKFAGFEIDEKIEKAKEKRKEGKKMKEEGEKQKELSRKIARRRSSIRHNKLIRSVWEKIGMTKEKQDKLWQEGNKLIRRGRDMVYEGHSIMVEALRQLEKYNDDIHTIAFGMIDEGVGIVAEANRKKSENKDQYAYDHKLRKEMTNKGLDLWGKGGKLLIDKYKPIMDGHDSSSQCPWENWKRIFKFLLTM